MDLSPQGHKGSGRKGQRRHRDPTPKPGLLQPRPLCNSLPVTYRTVLSRQAVQRSSRRGDPSPGLTRSPATGTGRGGAGPAGRGGAVTRSRARAGGRAGERSAGSGGAEAAAPLGSARLRSGCSGSRAGSAGRDPADRTTSPSSLPAGPRFPEGTRSQVLLLVFLPSLPLSGCEPDAAAAVARVPPLARAERAVCASRGPGRHGRAGSGGLRPSAVGRSRGVCACSGDEAAARSPHLPRCEPKAIEVFLTLEVARAPSRSWLEWLGCIFF